MERKYNFLFDRFFFYSSFGHTYDIPSTEIDCFFFPIFCDTCRYYNNNYNRGRAGNYYNNNNNRNSQQNFRNAGNNGGYRGGNNFRNQRNFNQRNQNQGNSNQQENGTTSLPVEKQQNQPSQASAVAPAVTAGGSK